MDLVNAYFTYTYSLFISKKSSPSNIKKCHMKLFLKKKIMWQKNYDAYDMAAFLKGSLSKSTLYKAKDAHSIN